jgi:choline dehydrogenase-like flavoprotein
MPPFNQDGATDHVYVPRYNHLSGTPDYAGGWGIQVNFDSYMFPNQAYRVPGYGAAFKERVRRMQPGYLFMSAFAKTVSARENTVTVDPQRLDAYGIPIPVVHYRFVENDYALWRAADLGLREICSRLKGAAFFGHEAAPSGFASHEVGTVRMGKDRRTSVLNSFCQSHEIKNLFVTDGSCFTSSSEKNPTLTIMALSMRAAEYIKQKRKQREL